jgi:hypothetical protein
MGSTCNTQVGNEADTKYCLENLTGVSKMDSQGLRYKDGDWIYVAQDNVPWGTFVNTVMNHLVSLQQGISS